MPTCGTRSWLTAACACGIIWPISVHYRVANNWYIGDKSQIIAIALLCCDGICGSSQWVGQTIIGTGQRKTRRWVHLGCAVHTLRIIATKQLIQSAAGGGGGGIVLTIGWLYIRAYRGGRFRKVATWHRVEWRVHGIVSKAILFEYSVPVWGPFSDEGARSVIVCFVCWDNCVINGQMNLVTCMRGN